MKTNPPLTVVLRAHNAESTIAQTIKSTLNQSFTDFELWVLENGSNDLTAEVARRFADDRIRVFELGAVGQSGAIQYAIENASSDWLALMDADDLMFPDRLKRQMEVIRQHPDLVMVGTGFALLTPFGHIFENQSRSSSEPGEVDILKMSRGRVFADGSVIFRRRMAVEVGGVDTEFRYADLPLFFRLLSRGRGWEIPEPLYLYRMMQSNSLSISTNFLEEARRIRLKYAPQSLNGFPKITSQGSRWSTVGALELLAGEVEAVRQAAALFESEEPKAAQRMRWLSHSGKFGRSLYKWRHPSMTVFRRRPDWEHLFDSLLRGQTGESEKNKDGNSQKAVSASAL